jgi:hypothetical protein
MKTCNCGTKSFETPCPICKKLTFYAKHYRGSFLIAYNEVFKKEEQDGLSRPNDSGKESR